MKEGIYEELITNLVAEQLRSVNNDAFYISKTSIDKEEAALILAKHCARTIRHALNHVKGDNLVMRQIEIANKIIYFLKDELEKEDFNQDLIAVEGEILKAVFNRVNSDFPDLDLRLKEITPYTRLTHSELFTGGNSGLSLESELKKEILSSDRIDLLVSFIKFKGIIILEKEFQEFTARGGQLRVITTTYMGASDYKAIQLLSKLPNTQVKISYNSTNERLHAKAYLFKRNTGFDTAYIGSSNFSRSALTDGLEWNIKITTKEISHVIDKFQKTFDSYWQSSDFELFDAETNKEQLQSALNKNKTAHLNTIDQTFFDIKPYTFQSEILEILEVERTTHNRNRNLVVAATGTGKTMIAAFDYKQFQKQNRSSKLLFIAHRKEILMQAAHSFRAVLRDNNFGSLWVDGEEPDNYAHVFASIQTLNNRLENLNLSPTYYDYIIIDECHHLTASSYRGLIHFFTPKVLLGLTATPERMDGGDIQEDFHNRIAAEIRLPDALNRKLLCPFQYFGVSDSVDLNQVTWERGRYVASELSNVYTNSERRVREIVMAIERYTKDINDVCALGFCVTIDHARYMANKFKELGLKADYLSSDNPENRTQVRTQLRNREINYLFVVDIFNEGVDIPEIDTVLFLRPTESLTIFLQQLGRGLRLAENKECLTVLDFVGNSRPEYNFENKFRAIIGKTSTTVKKEIEDNFPHLPLGCSVILEKKAKDIILENISAAIAYNRNKLIQRIKGFKHQTTLPLTLANFVTLTGVPLQTIYKAGGWSRLCFDAGIVDTYDPTHEKEIIGAIANKWLSTNSMSYFQFILDIARSGFNIKLKDLEEEKHIMLLMLYYDIWQKHGLFSKLEESIQEIGKNKILTAEVIELLEYLIDNISFKEVDIKLPFKQPLKVHARYTRDQILAAFGISTFDKKSTNREGVALNKELNTELLFINLIKSEENFSPTTMYEDYALSETLFHWQTQNLISPETPKGQSYINHKSIAKKILLFVRERNTDEFGNTMGFVFIGEGQIQDYYGSKPMSVTWELGEPLPNYLWKAAAKLRVG